MPHLIEYNPDKDYYTLLGVKPDSTLEEIKLMWRKRVFELHPDTNQKTEDKGQKSERIKDINEVYSVLKEQEKRRIYDGKRALFIAKTFKFKSSFYKNSRVTENYLSSIETHLKSDKTTHWCRRMLKSISSRILKRLCVLI